MMRRGVAEVVLPPPCPAQAAVVRVLRLEAVGFATGRLFFGGNRSPDALPRLERIVEAWADALERVLGAPAGCLQRSSRGELAQWLAPPSGQKEEQRG